MLVTPLGIVIEVKPVQSLNTFLAIPTTSLGISNEPVGLVPLYPKSHFFPSARNAYIRSPSFALLYKYVPLNASLPMLVTLLGIVIEVKLVQPENAPSPMLVTPSGIVIEVKPVQPENACSLITTNSFGRIMLSTSESTHFVPSPIATTV